MGPSKSTLKLSFNYVNRHLRLDPETGFLYWKLAGRGRQLNKPAGSKDSRGYITITLNYRRIRAHNIVWLLSTGDWPKQEIDHINQNNSDNRPSNLRDVSASENNFNRRCINPFGCPGIFQMPNGVFRAMYDTVCLGYFPTAAQAVAARKEFENANS